MLASIVISTYNRAAALPSTLDALRRQDLPATEFEVLVIDDGSTDTTSDVLRAVSVPFAMRTYRLPSNQGVSAARNVGLRNATGQYLIMVSDDLLVPEDFIRAHVATLRAHPDAWVVGGVKQLPSLSSTPFGRFLDRLERQFEQARIASQVAPGLYEMTTPTARNLSLRRSDLDRTGFFDERFRVTCEDQDLAHRARQHGIRFIYNTVLECVHNDQAGDLKRYCQFQQRGAQDAVRLSEKYPGVHDGSPIARLNGYPVRSDGAVLVARKLAKRVLSTKPSRRVIGFTIACCERLRLPDVWLHRGYRLLIGLHIFRGWREGLRETEKRRTTPGFKRG
jgi:GT2 family glycosyltransferase